MTKTIRIPEPMLERLDTLAAENGVSLNRLINQCVEFSLSNMEEQDTASDEEHTEVRA